MENMVPTSLYIISEKYNTVRGILTYNFWCQISTLGGKTSDPQFPYESGNYPWYRSYTPAT